MNATDVLTYLGTSLAVLSIFLLGFDLWFRLVLGAVLVAGVIASVTRLNLRESLAIRPDMLSVDDRIRAASESLRSAASLVDELQAEMQLRLTTLERLRVENAEYEKLAAVRKEEAAAVTELVEKTLKGAHVWLRRTTRRDQALFFVLGLLAAIALQLVSDLL